MPSVVEAARARLARRAQDQSAEQEVEGLEPALSAVLRDPSVNDVSLFERLVRRVGLGDDPKKRRLFFTRLVRVWERSPDDVERLIAEVWADSLGAKRRDLFFCFVLKRRLAEGRFTVRDGSEVLDEPI